MNRAIRITAIWMFVLWIATIVEVVALHNINYAVSALVPALVLVGLGVAKELEIQ